MSYHRVTITGRYHGQTIQNVIHLRNLDGTHSNQAIAAFIVSDWVPVFQNLHHNSFQYVSAEVREILTPTPGPAFNLPFTLVGGGGTTESPSFSCFKLRFGTALAGKKFRGRYYIGGISQALFNSGMVISATGITRLQAVSNNIVQKWCGVGPGAIPGLDLVIAHKDTQILPTLVISCIHAPIQGVQRRRNLGVGI